MGSLGKIYGYQLYESSDMVDKIIIRKQTRKFTNTRWVKKYLKKYTSFVPSKDVILDSEGKRIIGHPEAIRTLKLMAN